MGKRQRQSKRIREIESFHTVRLSRLFLGFADKHRSPERFVLVQPAGARRTEKLSVVWDYGRTLACQYAKFHGVGRVRKSRE
jgi:hypothetical protein